MTTSRGRISLAPKRIALCEPSHQRALVQQNQLRTLPGHVPVGIALQGGPVARFGIRLCEQQQHVGLSQAQLAPTGRAGVANIDDELIGALDGMKPFGRALRAALVPNKLS